MSSQANRRSGMEDGAPVHAWQGLAGRREPLEDGPRREISAESLGVRRFDGLLLDQPGECPRRS